MSNRRLKIAVKFSHLNILNKIKRATELADAIHDHKTEFKHPVPSPATINKAVEELDKQNKLAAKGGKSERADRQAASNKLDILIMELAHYVEKVADGNEEIINKSTFEIKKRSVRTQFDFEVIVPDDRGVVELKCKRSMKSVYIWQFHDGETPVFKEGARGITNSAVITNLQSGVTYWFRVFIVSGQNDTILGPKAATVN
ncbi:MAG: fibronectin type III domain-containing protein [Bacteroidetes bacterium]|nr:fibronectin type III domain-containing protein [Bacteroidota bacterium]